MPILVEVKKDSNDKKGARTTTHIKLTGKYIVLLPQTNIITISQKIEKEEEKQRLLKIVRKQLPENMGAIVRTIAENQKEEIIEKDIEQFQIKWKYILEKFNKTGNKAEQIYKSLSIVEKIIIDLPQ